MDKKELKGKVKGMPIDGLLRKSEVIDLIDQLAEPKGVPEEEFERLFEDHQKLAHELDDMKLRYEPDKYVKMALERGQQLLKIQSERDEAEKELRELKDMHPEKVVVPEFVEEWIDYCKNKQFDLHEAMTHKGMSRKASDWIEDCDLNLFARAWLDGFKVEEKKYEVKDKHGCFILSKNLDGEVINAYGKTVYEQSKKLTEKEIKDYDDRFWAFAVPVEEEEE